MPLADRPRLSQSYAANVVLVILTLFPGLINTSAIALAAPVIGRDLGVAPNAAATLPLISDAALAFGCVLAAELTRRLEGRALYFWLMGASLLTSLASALTPSYPLLLAAHVLHGLAAGMLFIVTLPPLLVNFGSARINATASVLVPALFGAATLGPLVGGFVAEPGLWRAIFASEAVVAIAAFALARITLERREPRATNEPIDWAALILSAAGSLLVYLGVGALAGHDWRDPYASGPVAAGVLLYAALIVVEARVPHPLVPVRKMATSLALVGTIATVIGSATYSALTQCFVLTLLHIDGLTARQVGLAFWPDFLIAVAAGFVFGKLVTTRWVVVTGAIGLGFIALAAAIAHVIAPVTPGEVTWLSLLAGFGAGLSVSPGLFVVTLSFERALVARAIALLNLFRLTGGFISAPGVEHTIGGRATRELLEQRHDLAAPYADAAMRALLTGRPVTFDIPRGALQHALAAGIEDAYVIVIVLAIAGIAAIVGLLLLAHVPFRAPDLRRFDNGEPALQAPALA